MQPVLQLYGTEACHLCEEAGELLHQLGLDWQSIDIAADDTLLERYGTSIPVLKRRDDGRELHWPFQLADVQRLAVSA